MEYFKDTQVYEAGFFMSQTLLGVNSGPFCVICSSSFPHLFLDYFEADSGHIIETVPSFHDNLNMIITLKTLIMVPNIFTYPVGDQTSPIVSTVCKHLFFTCEG